MGAPLSLAPALADFEAGGSAPGVPVRLGLAGAHQRGNAALAVALAAAWEARAPKTLDPALVAESAGHPRHGTGMPVDGQDTPSMGGTAKGGGSLGQAQDLPARGCKGGEGVGRAGGGAAQRVAEVMARRLPAEYLRGLAQCQWPGRAQVPERFLLLLVCVE